MNRIDRKFRALAGTGRAALMPYLPLGFPNLDVSLQLICALAEAGADMFELGIPFSDPLADGPMIQKATHAALQNGTTLGKCLELVRQVRDRGITLPLVLMGYYNPFLHFGIEPLAHAAAGVGADGFIVPDLPPEEAGVLDAVCRQCDLDLVFLAAPTSTTDRLRKIAASSSGFVYLVSVTGVTGVRTSVAKDLPEFVGRLRQITHKPICVGFGIASAESAKRVARVADGVIVGSALVSKIGEEGDPVKNARAWLSELRAAIDT